MEKKLLAVLTLTRDEKEFLPIWVRHYSSQLPISDIYILDSGTKDGSVEKIKKEYKVNIQTIPSTKWHDWLTLHKMICVEIERLFQHYQYVLYSDVDEIVFPNQAIYSSLTDYIEKKKEQDLMCAAVNSISIIQMPHEDPLDFSKPLLQQRQFCFKEAMYDKTLLSRVMLNWSEGFHVITFGWYYDDKGQKRYVSVSGKDAGFQDNDLYLIHLKRIDYNLVKQKNIRNIEQKKDSISLTSRQNFLIGKEFEEWFYTGGVESKFEKLPENIKQLL